MISGLALRACAALLAISALVSGYMYVQGLRSDLALAATQLEAERSVSKALHDQVETERAVRVAVDRRLADALAESEVVQERNRDLLDRIAQSRSGSRDGPVADVLREAVESLSSNGRDDFEPRGGRK